MLLSGEGGIAFCAGGDIVEMFKAKKKGIKVDNLIHVIYRQYLVDYTLS